MTYTAIPKILDRADAIARIQSVKSLYADSGVDVRDRIANWCKRMRLPTDLRELSDRDLSKLADAMSEKYLEERSTLTVTLPIAGYRPEQKAVSATVAIEMTRQEIIDESIDVLRQVLAIDSEFRSQAKRYAIDDMARLTKQEKRIVWDSLSEAEQIAFNEIVV